MCGRVAARGIEPKSYMHYKCLPPRSGVNFHVESAPKMWRKAAYVCVCIFRSESGEIYNGYGRGSTTRGSEDRRDVVSATPRSALFLLFRGTLARSSFFALEHRRFSPVCARGIPARNAPVPRAQQSTTFHPPSAQPHTFYQHLTFIHVEHRLRTNSKPCMVDRRAKSHSV